MSAAQRHPPAFQVEIGPQPALQGLVAAVAGLSAACLVAALAGHWPPLAWLCALIPAVSVFAWRQARVVPRHLLWDGQMWRITESLNETGREIEPRIVIDLDGWLLLRAGRLYLPLTRRLIGASWGQLRATLYAAP